MNENHMFAFQKKNRKNEFLQQVANSMSNDKQLT